MGLRDLHYFETIAELGHLGRAADQLGRSQPALTKSVQRLEESLGTRLFQREGRGIKLTAVGQLLLARSRQLRQNVEQTEREVRDFASGALGNIRLGCAASMADHLLPQLTAALLEQAPEVILNLVIGQDDLLYENLRHGRLDLIICSQRSADPAFHSQPLLEDEVVVVASHDHPLFEAPVELADLSRYRWVLAGPKVSSRRWIDHAFQSRGLPAPKVQIETNSIPLLPRLIAQTNLLSFLARETVEQGMGMPWLREVPLAETTLVRTLHLIARAGAYQSPAAQLLGDLLVQDPRRFFSG